MAEYLLHSDNFWFMSVWPITAAAVCAWLASKAIRNLKMTTWIWRACILKFLAVSFVPLSIGISLIPIHETQTEIPIRESVADDHRRDPNVLPTEMETPQVAVANPAANARPTQRRTFTIQSICKSGWHVGLCLGTVVLTIQWVAVRRRLRSMPIVKDSRIDAASREIAESIGLRRVPPIHLGRDVGSPQLVGLFRPAVVFPEWLIEETDDFEKRMILVHEFIHAKRRDLVWSLIAAIATIVFFFHPLAWFARRRLRIAQELMADSATLRVCGAEVRPYADLVLKIVEKAACKRPRQEFLVGAGLTFTELSERIRRMHLKTNSNSPWVSLAVILLILGFLPWYPAGISPTLASDGGVSASLDASSPDAQIPFDTLATDYSVKTSVQIEGQGLVRSSSETGSFLFDGIGKRAMYVRTATLLTGERWIDQFVFDVDTSLHLVRRDPAVPMKDSKELRRDPWSKVVAGQSNQTDLGWRKFLGVHALSVVTGHALLGSRGYQFDELLRQAEQKHSGRSRKDGSTEYVIGEYRIDVVRDAKFGDHISRLKWSFADPNAAPADPTQTTSGEFVVDQFEKIGDVWLPIKFTSTVKRGAGVAKLPKGLTIGQADQIHVPAKTIVTEVLLSNFKVHVPVRSEQFAIDVENGHAATNYDAYGTEYVVFNNKLVPKAAYSPK